jgi:hypothetical protein
VNRATRLVLGILLAACVLCVDAGQVQGQPPGAPGMLPRTQPAFSPYLNLLRQGNSPALNYFGLVRPELNFRSSINNLQQQANIDQQAIGDLQMSNLPTTGHSVMFLNTRGYFQSQSGGPGNNRGMQSMPAPPQGAAGTALPVRR